MFIDSSRDTDASALSKAFQTSCDIESFSVNLVPVNDNISKIYPNSKFHFAVFG